MNAVTVMFTVMKMIQQIMNAAPVMPVEMNQTISKHIMFRCHCWVLLQIRDLFWLMLDLQANVIEKVCQIQKFRHLCDHQGLACQKIRLDK